METKQDTTKRQLIDEITRYNPGAPAGYFQQFDERSLRQYLDRLAGVQTRALRMHSTSARTQRVRKAS